MNKDDSRNKLEQICDKVFLVDLAGKRKEYDQFNHKWVKKTENDYAKTIVYSQRISGVEIEIRAYMETTVKAMMCLIIGNGKDRKCIFNKISFSICKKSSFTKEIIRRLELDSLAVHIETILENRRIDKERQDNIKYKMDLLKRFFSFEGGYRGSEHLRRRAFFKQGERKLYRTFDIEEIGRDTPTLTIQGEIDFLIRIIAFADEIIKKET